MLVLVDAFNQKKALVGAFSVLLKTDGSFAALIDTEMLQMWPPSLSLQSRVFICSSAAHLLR